MRPLALAMAAMIYGQLSPLRQSAHIVSNTLIDVKEFNEMPANALSSSGAAAMRRALAMPSSRRDLAQSHSGHIVTS